MNRKQVTVLVSLIVCLITIILPQHTYAFEWINPYEVFKKPDLKITGEEPLFEKYDIADYKLDNETITEAASLVLTGGSSFVINTLMDVAIKVEGYGCLVVIYLTDWAFNYRDMDGAIEYIDTFVMTLQEKLFFGEFLGILIFFLGVSLIFSFGRNEDVAGKLLKVMINLVIAFTLLANMSLIVKTINELGRTGSNLIFTAFGEIPGNKMKKYTDDAGRNAMINVYDAFFNYNFYKAWQLANFGLYVKDDQSKWTAKEKQVAEDSHKSLTDDAWWDIEKTANQIGLKQIYNLITWWKDDEEDKSYAYVTMTPAGIPFRLLIVGLVFVIGSAYGALLLAIAGTTIFAQFFLILLALVSPLIFLLVLIPEWGDQILVKWVQGMMAAAVYWMVAALLLVVILFMQTLIYDISDDWFAAMFGQVVLLFVFFRFRGHIYEYIPIAQMAVFNATEQALFEKAKGVMDSVVEKGIEGGKTLLIGGAAITGVAMGNPAMIAGAKSRGGLMTQSLMKEAAKLRGEANESGLKKPNMARAMFMALKGEKLSDEQENKQRAGQRQSVQLPGAQDEQGRVSDSQKIDSAADEIAAALARAAAKIDGSLQQGQMTERERYQNIREGHHEVRDMQGNKIARMKNGEVFVREGNEERRVAMLGENGRLIHPTTHQPIGHVNTQTGQMVIPDGRTIGLSSGQITANIQPLSASASGSAKVIQPDVVIDPKVRAKDPNQTLDVDVKPQAKNPQPTVGVDVSAKATQPQQEIGVDVKAQAGSVNVEGGSQATNNPSVSTGSSTGQSSSPQVNVNVGGQNVSITQEGNTSHEYINVQSGDEGGGDGGSTQSPSSIDAGSLLSSLTGNPIEEEEGRRILEEHARKNKKKGFLNWVRNLFSGK